MTIDTGRGLIAQGRIAGLVNPTPGEMRKVLEDCLVTDWEEHLDANGVIIDASSRLISRYWIQKEYDIPAIWVGNAPDEHKPDDQGCEIVVYPDPQRRVSKATYKVNRWTFRIIDRTKEQTRIHSVMQVLDSIFPNDLYYVPDHEHVEDDLRYATGVIHLDLTENFRNLNQGRPPRDE